MSVDLGSGEDSSGRDWQIVDDSVLSQCGSSPRSVSNLEYDSHLEELLNGSESQKSAKILKQKSVVSAADTESHKGSSGSQTSLDDFIPESTQALVPRSSTDISLLSQDMLGPSEEREISELDFTTHAQLHQGGICDEEASASEYEVQEPGEGQELSTKLQVASSGNSSFISVGQSSEANNTDLQDFNSEVREEEGSLVDMESEVDSSSDCPASGQEDLHPSSDVQSAEDLSVEKVEQWELSSVAEDLPLLPTRSVLEALSNSSQSSLTSSEVAKSVPCGVGKPKKPKHWSLWSTAGTGKARGFLERMWSTMQIYVDAFAAYIPISLRARLSSAMQSLSPYSMKNMGRCNVMLASGLVSVSVLLLWTLAKNRALKQELFEKRNDLHHHIMTILDLNERLTRGLDIPSTAHCGFKPSLSMSWSAGPAMSLSRVVF